MTDILCLEKNDLNNKSLNTYIEMADIDDKNDNTDCVSKNELINEMFKDGHALLNTKPYDKIPVAKWGGVLGVFGQWRNGAVFMLKKLEFILRLSIVIMKKIKLVMGMLLDLVTMRITSVI